MHVSLIISVHLVVQYSLASFDDFALGIVSLIVSYIALVIDITLWSTACREFRYTFSTLNSCSLVASVILNFSQFAFCHWGRDFVSLFAFSLIVSCVIIGM